MMPNFSLRRAAALTGTFALVAVLSACAPPFEQNVCNQASGLLDSCGVSLTLLTDGACSGSRQALAECIVDNASTCREVTGLYSEADQCLARYADDDPNISDIPGAPSPGGNNGGDESEPEDTDERCSDGADNDGDGYIDCEDVGCSQNDAVGVCGLLGAEDTVAACQDGFDNDGDGPIDCADTGCQNTPGAGC